ncbi:hypothetical protein ABBQ32_011085 [Trebouxia sp. C0010 RCD-2024]
MLDQAVTRVTDLTRICAAAHRTTPCHPFIKLKRTKYWLQSSPASASRRKGHFYRLQGRQHTNRITTALWSSSSGSNGSGAAQSVQVTVERSARNSRRLYAAVQIAAPVEVVWGALTDYQGLGNFIPGLTENRCLSKKPTGATLLQVGEQDVAFGAKFRARVVLNIEEHSEGTPQRLCRNDTGSSSTSADERLFPMPRSPPCDGPCRDVCFSLVEGDFQAFQGIWRMQQGQQGMDSCRLSYALFVRPQVWLPIRLIQNRVENEIKNNLAAVRRHSEALHGRQGSRQGAREL